MTMPKSVYEVIQPEPDQSFRWHRHDYPAPCARWNHHPEYELHLITRGEGKAMIGDYIGSFSGRQLMLIGPDLPHAWFSTLPEGDRIEGRDVVLQFSKAWVDGLVGLCPELRSLNGVLEVAQRGLEFTGPLATRLGNSLEMMGDLQGAERLAACIEIFAGLSRAPYRMLSIRVDPVPPSPPDMASMASTIRTLMASDPALIRHERLAREQGLSPSQFSRRFRAATGDTFMSFLHRLRISHACQLLATTDLSVTEISEASGFHNLSNFNRIFLRLRHVTPRSYRRDSRRMTATSATSGRSIWH